MIKFSDLIKSKREKLNIKLSQLEKETGITASYISRIEKGQIKGVSGENVFKLAEALEISMTEIAQSFSVKLKDTNKDVIMDSLKNKLDYILVKQAIDCILDIANNEKEYSQTVSRIIHILDELKKSKITVIGMTDDSNADYAIEVKNNDEYIVGIVKDKLRDNLGAKVIVVEGEYLYGDNDVNYYSIEDFVEDFIEDDFEKEEINEYMEKNNY